MAECIFRMTSTKLNSCNKSMSANKDFKIHKTLDTIIFYRVHLITVIVKAFYIVYDEGFSV